MADRDGIDVIVRLSKVLEIALADVGLTMNQFRLLTLVQERSPSAAELSARLVMKAPNVSAMTKALVDRGLVERTQQVDDGRRRELLLTPAGEALLGAAHERCAVALRGLAAQTGDERLIAQLARWLPALDAAAVTLRRQVDG